MPRGPGKRGGTTGHTPRPGIGGRGVSRVWEGTETAPFDPVQANISFPELEQETLEFWRTADVFHRQLE
ncbi:MAG: hypothetical protein WD965_01090, partial [Actinomycetota bacterium]